MKRENIKVGVEVIYNGSKDQYKGMRAVIVSDNEGFNSGHLIIMVQFGNGQATKVWAQNVEFVAICAEKISKKRKAHAVVGVCFLDGINKVYAYKNELKLRLGDIVVVEARGSMGVAEVVSLDQSMSGHATAYTIQRICLKAHQKRVDHMERIVHLKKDIEARKHLVRKQIETTQLAEKDDVLASMIAKLEKLSK